MSQSNPLIDTHTEPPHRPPHEDDEEKVYYEGSPLLRGDLGRMIVVIILSLVFIGSGIFYFFQSETPNGWIVLALIALGCFLPVIPYLLVKRTRYRITNYRIDYERGILSKTIDTLELWHVEDIKFHQSMMDRMLAVGTIEVVSGDASTPRLSLRSLPHPRPTFEALKQRIIAIKRQRGVIKMDIG